MPIDKREAKCRIVYRQPSSAARLAWIENLATIDSESFRRQRNHPTALLIAIHRDEKSDRSRHEGQGAHLRSDRIGSCCFGIFSPFFPKFEQRNWTGDPATVQIANRED